MNPSGMTDDPGSQNRPSVFSEMYPPSNRTPLEWHATPGTSNVPFGDYGMGQNPGFNMLPQVGMNWPNFQFSGGSHPMGQTIQFPFPNTHHDRIIEKPMCTFRAKRKTDSPPLQPAKQLITEEKMSEHLSKLHISSETPTTEMESDQLKEQRLYMCEEMKKFQAQTDPIIPESLLTSLNRPCTALVLWKPPSSLLVPHLFNRNQENEESENNNNNSEIDNNPSVPPNDMEFEDL